MHMLAAYTIVDLTCSGFVSIVTVETVVKVFIYHTR